MSNANDMAFPVLDKTQTPNDTTQLGLTKREYAAIQIAAGLAANSIPGGQHHAEKLADEAVRKADAVLARLACGY